MATFFLLGGFVILAVLFAKIAVRRTPLPPVVVYLLIGVIANAANMQLRFLDGHLYEAFHVLAEMGIIILLFRVGLKSNLGALLGQLKKASLIWFGNVSLSGVLGFVAAYYLLHFSLLASLFVAVALSATSVGVAAAIWQDAERLDTKEGALLIDVAELDDISAIISMALLFSLVPVLRSGQALSFGLIAAPLSLLLLKFAGFVVFCYLFSVFLEARITSFLRAHSMTSLLVAVIGITFVISGLASWLGFSLAIGAIFSGFAFSRDPSEMEIDHELETIFQLFVPFFFVNIGLGVRLDLIVHALVPGLVLFAVAALGKLIGTTVPAMLVASKRQSLILGISMIPRAEIAMVVMLYGYKAKSPIVSSHLFGAMVMVTLLSCLLVPPVLHGLFAKTPSGVAASEE